MLIRLEQQIFILKENIPVLQVISFHENKDIIGYQAIILLLMSYIRQMDVTSLEHSYDTHTRIHLTRIKVFHDMSMQS